MRKKGKELKFISRIKRDGSGTIPITDSMEDYDELVFTLHPLSLTEGTFIVIEFNSYVVKLKHLTNRSV